MTLKLEALLRTLKKLPVLNMLNAQPALNRPPNEAMLDIERMLTRPMMLRKDRVLMIEQMLNLPKMLQRRWRPRIAGSFDDGPYLSKMLYSW